jgi:hypothetical protein
MILVITRGNTVQGVQHRIVGTAPTRLLGATVPGNHDRVQIVAQHPEPHGDERRKDHHLTEICPLIVHTN